MLHVSPVDLNWEEMPEMGDEDLGVYTPSDSPIFSEIRDALMSRGLLGAFGIYLVHKHFQIDSDEEMVETVDFDAEAIFVQPVKRRLLNMDDMVPTNWVFAAPREGEVQVQVAQWGHAKDLSNAERNPFADAYAECLDEISHILHKHGAQDRFGMFLIRKQFSFEAEENQLECTNQENRLLVITTKRRDDTTFSTVSTNWIFTPDETVASACCDCAKNSGGYHQGTHRSR